MATYVLCNGSTPVNYEITVATVGGLSYNDWVSGGYHYIEKYQTYRITSDAAVIGNLDVTWSNLLDVSACNFDAYEGESGCTPIVSNVHNYYTATILNGNTYVDFVLIYYQNYHVNPTGAGQKQERDTVVIEAQASTPTCGSPPPSCYLVVTGVTASDPSQRGATDGSISAGVGGATGSTITWYINGVVSAGTAHTHTFSGLGQGTYYIKAVEGPCWDQEIGYVGEGEFVTGDFTVVSPVGNIVAAENPVMLNLSTAVNSYSPVISASEFKVTGTIANVIVDFALTFPYVYNAQFKSKAYPDRSSYFLESTLKDQVGNVMGNNNALEITTSIAEAFQSDPIISRIYYISSSGNTVTMIAKEYSDQYDLTSANVTITGSNLTLVNVSPGIAQYDGQLTSNYSLYTELFVDNAIQYGDTPVVNYYRRVTELELPFSNDNIHQFDLSSTLKNFVYSPKFSFVFTGATFLGSMIASYFCKYGEKFPLVPDSNTKKKRYKGQTGYGWVINSALNFEDPNSMVAYSGTSIGSGHVDNVKFLNTAPNTKYSHKDAKELLYFMVAKNYGFALSVYGNIHLYDGSVVANHKFFDIIPTGQTVNYGGVAVINVSYDDLNLQTFESTSKVRKVDIVVKQNTGSTIIPYTEVKSYLLEVDEQPSNYNLAFLSKLGTYETYSFVGENVESQDIQKSTYQRPYGINNDGSAQNGFQYNSVYDTKYTKIFTINSGIIDSDTYYFLQGLLASNRIYNYDNIHENFVTIIGQTSVKSSNNNEYTIQVQLKETISENNVNS